MQRIVCVAVLGCSAFQAFGVRPVSTIAEATNGSTTNPCGGVCEHGQRGKCGICEAGSTCSGIPGYVDLVELRGGERSGDAYEPCARQFGPESAWVCCGMEDEDHRKQKEKTDAEAAAKCPRGDGLAENPDERKRVTAQWDRLVQYFQQEARSLKDNTGREVNDNLFPAICEKCEALTKDRPGVTWEYLEACLQDSRRWFNGRIDVRHIPNRNDAYAVLGSFFKREGMNAASIMLDPGVMAGAKYAANKASGNSSAAKEELKGDVRDGVVEGAIESATDLGEVTMLFGKAGLVKKCLQGDCTEEELLESYGIPTNPEESLVLTQLPSNLAPLLNTLKLRKLRLNNFELTLDGSSAWAASSSSRYLTGKYFAGTLEIIVVDEYLGGLEKVDPGFKPWGVSVTGKQPSATVDPGYEWAADERKSEEPFGRRMLSVSLQEISSDGTIFKFVNPERGSWDSFTGQSDDMEWNVPDPAYGTKEQWFLIRLKLGDELAISSPIKLMIPPDGLKDRTVFTIGGTATAPKPLQPKTPVTESAAAGRLADLFSIAVGEPRSDCVPVATFSMSATWASPDSA